jgi:hypothetical protein
LSTALGSSVGAPREDASIARGLSANEAAAERARRIRDVVETSFPVVAQHVESVVGDSSLAFADGPGTVPLADLSTRLARAAEQEAGVSRVTYLRTKLLDAIDGYAGMIAYTLDYPSGTGHARFVGSVLRAWARRTGLLEQASSPTEAQLTFLRAFDVGYLARRLTFARNGVNILYERTGLDGNPPRADLDAVKSALSDCLDRVSEGVDAAVDTPGFREPVVGLFPPAQVLDALAAGDPDADTFAKENAQRLDEIARRMQTLLVDRLDQVAADAFAAITSLTTAWAPTVRRELFVRFLGFPYWDGLLYQLQEEGGAWRDAVSLWRISPRDATLLGSRVERGLEGARLHHYWGFFSRESRETDYLWGRLDAAELLVELVIGRKHPRFRSWCMNAFAAVLNEEESRLPHAGRLIATIRASITAESAM